MDDYYNTLGVAKNATPDEIKKAYRRLASIHHPDKGGDTATFQTIQTAYETLSDPQKKHNYDNPQQHHQSGFPGGFHFSNQGFDINDIFGQMFGQRQRNTHPTYKTDVWVSLEQVYGGGEQVLQFNNNQLNQTIKIDIPKGVDNGQQIRYENMIPNATLIVEFRIKPHERFERRGPHIWASSRVSVLDLIVGTSFEFLTLSGKTFEVTVPPKTQPGSVLRISGQGIVRGNIAGDQMILLEPYIPDIIDEAIIDSIRKSKQT
jgi:DnaJ-class molecular chaperone